MLTNALALLCALIAVPSALAGHLPARQATPSIPFTYPSPGVVWVPGETHNITWDTSQVTPQLPPANIFLAKAGVADTNPLVPNVNLTQGHANLVVPNVTAGNDYSLRLAVGQVTAESGDFTIAPSTGAASSLSAGPPATGSTVIVFPSTTITTDISATPSSASAAASSLSSAASSVSKASSALSSATAPHSSSSSPASSGSSSAARALHAPEHLAAQLACALGVIVLGSVGAALVL